MVLTKFSRGFRFLLAKQQESPNELKETLEASIDNPPTQEEIKAALSQLQTIASDRTVTEAEKEAIVANIQERLTSLGLTEAELNDLNLARQEIISNSPFPQSFRANQRLSGLRGDNFSISDAQKENVIELKETLEASIDNPPTQEEIKAALSQLQTIASDRIVTEAEKEAIVANIQERLTSLGLTEAELNDLNLARQEIISNSRLPQTSETYQGTSKNDLLLGFGGNDFLVGSPEDGTGEKDVLMGGAGKDSFTLGTESTVFYNDGISNSEGINDFAPIMDFNIPEDSVELYGSADDYSLGAIPGILQSRLPNLERTALYYQEVKNPELVGVFLGAKLDTLEQGFNFV